MKRVRCFLVIASVSIFAFGSVHGAIVWDSGHHEFTDGDEGFVTVNNAATAAISGGSIHWLTGNNQSILTLTGGTITNLMTNDTSAAIIEDVYSYGEYWTHGDSSLAFNGGEVHWISTFDNSSVVLSNGQLEGLFAEDQSHVEIRGGAITARIVAYESSVIDIYGYDFNYNSLGGQWNEGQLSGYWENGVPFSIDLQNWDRENGITYDHINLHIVPEPSMLVLMGVGGLFLRHGK